MQRHRAPPLASKKRAYFCFLFAFSLAVAVHLCCKCKQTYFRPFFYMSTKAYLSLRLHFFTHKFRIFVYWYILKTYPFLTFFNLIWKTGCVYCKNFEKTYWNRIILLKIWSLGYVFVYIYFGGGLYMYNFFMIEC